MRYWRKYDLKKLFLENGRYIMTVVHETGNLKKSRHCKICWRKPSSGHMTGAQPIGTLSLSLWNDLWLVKICHHGLDFSKAWKRRHEEEQKSSFLSEQLNYNMLKAYYGIFAKLCQKIVAYCHFKDSWGGLIGFIWCQSTVKTYRLIALPVLLQELHTLGPNFSMEALAVQHLDGGVKGQTQ